MTAHLHPAFVVVFARPREAGLEQLVAGQFLEVLGELSQWEMQLAHNWLEVVLDHPLGHADEAAQGMRVAVEQGQLILAFVPAKEVPGRVHQADKQFPDPSEPLDQFVCDTDEVNHRLIVRTMNQGSSDGASSWSARTTHLATHPDAAGLCRRPTAVSATAAAHRPSRLRIAFDSVAANHELARHRPLAWALDQYVMAKHVHILHP